MSKTGGLGWLHGWTPDVAPLEVLARHGAPLWWFTRCLAVAAGVSERKTRKWLGVERGRVSVATCARIEAALLRREAELVDVDLEAEMARRADCDARVVGVGLRNLLWERGHSPRCYPSPEAPYPGAERLPRLPDAPSVVVVDDPPLRLAVPPLRLGTRHGDAIRDRLRAEVLALPDRSRKKC